MTKMIKDEVIAEAPESVVEVEAWVDALEVDAWVVEEVETVVEASQKQFWSTLQLSVSQKQWTEFNSSLTIHCSPGSVSHIRWYTVWPSMTRKILKIKWQSFRL